MNRPSFQFYTDRWRNNLKLRRCTPAARGSWIDVMCLMHESEEYGVLRWPLREIAETSGCQLRLLRELSEKLVMKGSDGPMAGYIYTPRHAGKDGEPVTLIEPNDGPCWYSSRMVRDEYVRSRSGGSTRFGRQGGNGGNDDPPSPSQRQGAQPSARHGAPPSQRQGTGALSLSLSCNTLGLGTVPSVQGTNGDAKVRTNGAEAPEKQTHARWQDSLDGIVHKGATLGIKARSGESANAFKDRVFEAIAIRERGAAN